MPAGTNSLFLAVGLIIYSFNEQFTNDIQFLQNISPSLPTSGGDIHDPMLANVKNDYQPIPDPGAEQSVTWKGRTGRMWTDEGGWVY